jgi:tRNA/tmRNA/rRNA uracil-C5-methylase (TrmA/RlmC/RlmD family)
VTRKNRRIFQAAVESVAFGGSGVARLDGLAAFIPFTVDGDVVEAETRVEKKRHIVARLKRVITPSARRTGPRCPYFGRCGGCQYQHIDYGHQLEIKRRQVEDALRRIGGFADAPVRPVTGSPQPYSYRGKAEFHVSFDGGELCAGFFDTTGARVIDIERCDLVDESINRSYAQRRQSLFDGDRPRADRFAIWSESAGGQETHELQVPDDAVVRMVKGRTFLAPAAGFFQGNIFLTDNLVDTVLEAADCRASDEVLDLYCGSGLFSVFLAGSGAHVTGIEIDADAVEFARANARAAGPDRAEFREGRVEECLESLNQKTFSVIVLDPPRAGCDKEVLCAVAARRPQKIVYISCDPATQARDLRILAAQGFSLQYVQPLDMFPQTKHIEAVALLIKEEG